MEKSGNGFMTILFSKRNLELKNPLEFTQLICAGSKLSAKFCATYSCTCILFMLTAPRNHMQTEPIMLLCPEALFYCPNAGHKVMASNLTVANVNLQGQGEKSIWTEELPVI